MNDLSVNQRKFLFKKLKGAMADEETRLCAVMYTQFAEVGGCIDDSPYALRVFRTAVKYRWQRLYLGDTLHSHVYTRVLHRLVEQRVNEQGGAVLCAAKHYREEEDD